jgi:hypothetical protein
MPTIKRWHGFPYVPLPDEAADKLRIFKRCAGNASDHNLGIGSYCCKGFGDGHAANEKDRQVPVLG